MPTNPDDKVGEHQQSTPVNATTTPTQPQPANNSESAKVETTTESASPQATARGPLPFRNRDQILFAIACTVALFCMATYCVRTSRWGADPIELERQPEHVLDYKIDLNSATWVEWAQLPGIGPVLANRIVEDRKQNGPFRDVHELDRVKGIGRKKIEAIQAFVRTESSEDRAQSFDRPTEAQPSKSP